MIFNTNEDILLIGAYGNQTQYYGNGINPNLKFRGKAEEIGIKIAARSSILNASFLDKDMIMYEMVKYLNSK